VGHSLTGFYTLEVVVDLPGPWWREETARELQNLSDALSRSPVVARVLSPLDLLSQVSFEQTGTYQLPRGGAQTQVFLAFLEATAGDSLRTLATPSGETIRLSAIVRTMDEEALMDLVSQTRKSLDDLPQGYSGQVTGLVLGLVQAQSRLLESQLKTLALAVLLVIVAMGVGLASWRLALLALAPNALPILGIFGIMAISGIPLDAATATVASIALGIGVDDAVHILQGYRRRRSQGLGLAWALRKTLEEVGPALTVTTATACVGFGLLSWSAFVPIRHFAFLATLALVLALLADILWVPAAIQLIARWTGRAKRSAEE
jgi:predicted RND superfamily exporter protein